MNGLARALVIAEAGVNHNGSLDMARRLVDAAFEAGADAVKFQTFRANAMICRSAPKAGYQMRTTGGEETQLEMVRRLELSESAHEALLAHARGVGIRFLSSPFDVESLELLTARLRLDTVKIASGEITNAPLLVAVGRSRCHVILSTGMSTLAEIEHALGVLAYGYGSTAGAAPTGDDFGRAFGSEAGQAALRRHVSLLHCTSEYPAPAADVNLRAVDTLARAFGLPAGLSDHTQGIHIPVAAVARGAAIVEKHFTLDRMLPGPDHAASLEPPELVAMVHAIREVEAALGDGVKRAMPSELGNRDIARKSLVAARALRKGQHIGPDDIAVKRPGTGIEPGSYWSWIGRESNRDYAVDQPLEP